MKKLTLQDFQNRLDIIHPQEYLEAIEWNGDIKDSIVRCKKCNTYYTKKGQYFLDKRKVSICKTCFPTQPNTLKTDWQPNKDYILLSKYNGMHHKVLLKHKICGFCWYITPANLQLGKGCPKCNKKVSKGEQKIIQFLTNNNIIYKTQVPVKIENHTLFVDFYLPEYDLYIEYNGIQHFKVVKHFGGEERFIQQQYNDNLKKKYFKDKLLIISYNDFENIEKILKSSTTIPKGSTL